QVSCGVSVSEEELRVSVHVRSSGVPGDYVTEVGGEDRVLEVAGQYIWPGCAGGKDSHAFCPHVLKVTRWFDLRLHNVLSMPELSSPTNDAGHLTACHH